MSTSWIVETVLEGELILFGIFGLAAVGLALWFLYILERWSWIPRKRSQRVYRERL